MNPDNNQNPNNPNPNPNSNHACAACRYQRRKCNRDCPLAPYFPPDSPTKFLNAHKLFGVGNIQKMIRGLSDPKERNTAMETMMIQSDLRAKDPVLGCFGYIMNLQREIATHQNELNLVLNRIACLRAHHHHHQSALMMNHNHNNNTNGVFINNQNYVDADHDYTNHHPHHPQQQQQQQQQGDEQGGGGYEGILDQESVGGGGGNFHEDLNNEHQWRLMNENNDSGLENGEDGMNNMMMMMMMKEEIENEDALVPIFEERQFFDGFDRPSNETNIECSSSENIPKVVEPGDSIVQNEEQTIRKERYDSIMINKEETKNTVKHVQEN